MAHAALQSPATPAAPALALVKPGQKIPRKPRKPKPAKAPKFDTPGARLELEPRKSDYWKKLRVGQFLGYRTHITRNDVAGNWCAKVQKGRAEEFLRFGKLEHIPEAGRYDEALKLALQWFNDIDAAGGLGGKDGMTRAATAPSRIELRTVLDDYVQSLKQKPKNGARASKTADAAMVRFLGEIGFRNGELLDKPLTAITAREWKAFRDWMFALPTYHGGNHVKAGGQRKIGTVNRDIVTIRAALNHTADMHPGMVRAWEEPLKRLPGEDEESRGQWAYMPIEDRRKLFAAMAEVSPGLLAFAQVQLVVPVRPGAMAALKVRDYDPRNHMLDVHTDKAGAGRYVPITQDAADTIFAPAVKGKRQNDPLFTDPKGNMWTANEWGDQFKAAVRHAGLDDSLVMYCLRHSRITDLVEANMNLSTVAKLAGTSVKMIEKTYAHLQKGSTVAILDAAKGF